MSSLVDVNRLKKVEETVTDESEMIEDPNDFECGTEEYDNVRKPNLMPLFAKKSGSHWETFVVGDDGHVFVASTDFAEPLAQGFVTRFNSFDCNDMLHIEPNHYGCSQLAKGPNQSVVAGFDSGHIEIYNYDLSNAAWEKPTSSHETYITALATTPAKPDQLISAAADGEVRVWDLEANNCTRSYLDCHPFSPRTVVSLKPGTCNELLTTGDESLKFRDIRRNDNSFTLLAKMKDFITACIWSDSDSNLIFCGSEEGSIVLFDVRNTKLPVLERALDNGLLIHQLRWFDSDLGVVTRTPKVYALNPTTLQEEFSQTYEKTILDAQLIDGKLIAVGNADHFFQHDYHACKQQPKATK